LCDDSALRSFACLFLICPCVKILKGFTQRAQRLRREDR
jgi:hypothetical protein